MASAILYFAFPEQYPVYDYHVIWSLGWPEPKTYNSVTLWDKYRAKITEISQATALTIRMVEKAMWVYGKRYQTNNWSQRPDHELAEQ